MHVDQPPGDGQAKAGTAIAPGRPTVTLVKFIKNLVQSFGGNTDTGILDQDFDAAVPQALADVTSSGVLVGTAHVAWIVALLGIAWFAPNAMRIMARARFPFSSSWPTRTVSACISLSPCVYSTARAT